MIEVKNITKSYGNKKVVDNVSLNIQEGKITSFIGPNGAGKSTLLSIMSRLLKRDSGEVLLDGKDILDWDNKELVSCGRFPHSQGNLKEEDYKYIDEAIDYMQLKEFEDRYLDELSGGQRQRAYIAMVIAQNSDYIFLDEPLNNLDMKHSVEIMKTLRKLCDELNKTVVIVIHDINFASCYSDYIVALKDGKLVKNGVTEETIQKEELESIYEIDFHIENINNRNICVYF